MLFSVEPFNPDEKPKFTNNVMPDECRTLYLNSGVLGNLDNYITLAKNSGINAFVVDIKDGVLGYASVVASNLSFLWVLYQNNVYLLLLLYNNHLQNNLYLNKTLRFHLFHSFSLFLLP